MGKYRDTVRDYWRGEPATLGEFASRLTGSADLYETSGWRPVASINFVTAHDGFTLADLVYDAAVRLPVVPERVVAAADRSGHPVVGQACHEPRQRRTRRARPRRSPPALRRTHPTRSQR